MPPYAHPEMDVSILKRSYPKGIIAIAKTCHWEFIPIPKVSDGVLGVVASVRGRIESISIQPEYARELVNMGGAGALLVNKKIQLLVHQALKDTFPGIYHSEPRDWNDD